MSQRQQAYREMLEEIKKFIKSRAAQRSVLSGEEGPGGNEPEVHAPESDEPDGDELGGEPTGGHHENDADEPSDIDKDDFREVMRAWKKPNNFSR